MEHIISQREFAGVTASLYTGYDGIITVTKESKVRMNKGGRDGSNPLYGRVTMRKTEAYRWADKSYPEIVREAQERAGLEPNYGLDGAPEKPSPYVNAAPLRNKNKLKMLADTGELYLVCYVEIGGSGLEPEVEYFVDGEPATENELDIIAQYGGMKEGVWATSQTLMDATGLSAEELPQYKQIKLADIVSVEIGRETFIFE